jgi:hypothetical protein
MTLVFPAALVNKRAESTPEAAGPLSHHSFLTDPLSPGWAATLYERLNEPTLRVRQYCDQAFKSRYSGLLEIVFVPKRPGKASLVFTLPSQAQDFRAIWLT